MIVVLDASAGIEIVFRRQKADFFRGIMEASEKVISSDLYRIETANVLWKYYRAKIIDKETAYKSLQITEELVDEYARIEDYNKEALHESLRFDQGVYDMLYLTLAQQTNAILFTMDKRLKELALQAGIQAV